ncbi:hypothetical protein HPP92_014605 [Vanilla planifolia]|uniref:WAT1-related protein n=1 Tax=Vanilla planifolia TaxID=51239 RepID=A0A835QLR6_VANPL|nr:hypothetical protein HPP92_014605 [Vanilla planifolia]
MSFLNACFPYLCMILVQLAYGGMNVLIKVAMQQGLSHHVFVAYRHILASAISGPLAYVLERKRRPPLSLRVLVKLFFLALFGVTMQQNIFFAGLRYISPTAAGAAGSLIPAFTYVLALLLRKEKLRLDTAKGRAKIFGTLTCVSGALVFTFWKGHLLRGFVKKPFIDLTHGKEVVKENWIKGSLLIIVSNVAFCSWIVFQGMVFEVYPARLSFNALMCFFTSLQSSVEALFFERNKSSWKLGWNINLLTVVYTGVVVSCVVYNLQIYCISEKGPLFSAIFSPLLLVLMGISSAVLYAERLHLGSLIGATIIVVGLYSVLWGKADGGGRREERGSRARKELQISVTQSPISNL